MEQKHLELIRKVEYPSLGERPVEMVSSRLYQNTETLQMVLYLAFHNISGKTVTAVYVDLCCFDEEVNLVLTKTMVPLESLQVEEGGVFETEPPITLSSLRIRSITATVHRICFADGTQWDCRAQESADDANGKGGELKKIWDSYAPISEQIRIHTRVRTLAGLLILVLLATATGIGTGIYRSRQETALAQGVALFQERQYWEASEVFAKLQGTWIPPVSKEELGWYQALCQVQNGEYCQAMTLLMEQPNHEESVMCLRQLNAILKGVVAAGEHHSIGLCTNGTAQAVGDNSYGQCMVGSWNDLVAVAAGWNHTLGLKKDGTVYAAGASDACQVEAWNNVVAIAAGENHSVGVLNNGRVVAVGDNSFGQCDVGAWSGIIAVAAGRNHTVALRQDGTVYANGDNPSGGCNVEQWRDVVSIAAGDGFTLGLTKEGTILVAGDSERYGSLAEYSGLSVFAGGFHGMTLGTDGVLMAAGSDDWHQCQVGHWETVYAAAGGVRHSVGVKQDGTAFAIGANQKEACNVANWHDLGLPQDAIRLTAMEVYHKQVK